MGNSMCHTHRMNLKFFFYSNESIQSSRICRACNEIGGQMLIDMRGTAKSTAQFGRPTIRSRSLWPLAHTQRSKVFSSVLFVEFMEIFVTYLVDCFVYFFFTFNQTIAEFWILRLVRCVRPFIANWYSFGIT